MSPADHCGSGRAKGGTVGVAQSLRGLPRSLCGLWPQLLPPASNPPRAQPSSRKLAKTVMVRFLASRPTDSSTSVQFSEARSRLVGTRISTTQLPRCQRSQPRVRQGRAESTPAIIHPYQSSVSHRSDGCADRVRRVDRCRADIQHTRRKA
ncbi:hypothetical protein K461DRAFT_35906 [Myriangium duriaei CBS 260.36]|uniref:Uncharacterized protein n=1 Tax=Myriangium duriaei CBS 260.36 TaxID=1168546 RepID=A0A9P4MJK8_9PEZI|nr:hypothetical protein K461DRAFT_35906 [Myriangium duriaei CBS 260.36]